MMAAKGHAEPPDCRLLSNPSRIAPLTSGVMDDLVSNESDLSPRDLTTPTEAQAERAAQFRSSERRVLWACGSPVRGRIMVIYRSKESAYRCIAGPGCPSRIPLVWVTCWQGLDLATGRRTTPSGCMGFPSAER